MPSQDDKKKPIILDDLYTTEKWKNYLQKKSIQYRNNSINDIVENNKDKYGVLSEKLETIYEKKAEEVISAEKMEEKENDNEAGKKCQRIKSRSENHRII